MKKIVLTLGVCFVIIVMISCVRTEKDNLTLNKPYEYYRNYVEKGLIINGIKNTEYFQTGVDHDKAKDSYKNLSHSEIMSVLDEFILMAKKEFEETTLLRTKEVNLLISTVKEYNLTDKEEFYKKLLDTDSDIKRINLLYKERDKYYSELEEAKINNDVRLTLKIIDEYSYLTLLARDEEGTYIHSIYNIHLIKKKS